MAQIRGRFGGFGITIALLTRDLSRSNLSKPSRARSQKADSPARGFRPFAFCGTTKTAPGQRHYIWGVRGPQSTRCSDFHRKRQLASRVFGPLSRARSCVLHARHLGFPVFRPDVLAGVTACFPIPVLIADRRTQADYLGTEIEHVLIQLVAVLDESAFDRQGPRGPGPTGSASSFSTSTFVAMAAFQLKASS